jgi:hypothetical protein
MLWVYHMEGDTLARKTVERLLLGRHRYRGNDLAQTRCSVDL